MQGLTRAGVIVSLRQSYIRGKGMVVVASSAAFLDSDSPQFLFANLRDRKCLLPADHAFEAFNLTGFSYAFLGS